MITRDQVEIAKSMWEQSRQSAALAHECWNLLIQSRKSLIESFRNAGFPYTDATQNFEKLMEEHSDRYKKALGHMDSMSKVYGELLEQFKKAST